MALLAQHLLQLDGVLVQHVEDVLGLVLLQVHKYIILFHLGERTLQQALGFYTLEAEGGLVVSQQSWQQLLVSCG